MAKRVLKGALIGAAVTLFLVLAIVVVRAVWVKLSPHLDLGLSSETQPTQPIEVTRIVEVTRVIVVTATPDLPATVLAEAYAKSTASVAQANAEATMVSVETTQEAQLQRAAQTATSSVATRQATPIRVTSQPVSSTVIVSTVTPGPSPTPTSAVRIAVVNDNSAVENVRQEMVKRLQAGYPNAEVASFKGCDHRLVTETWSLILMDRKMEGSIDGPTCMQGIYLVHPDTSIIGISLSGGKHALLDAGAVSVCDTGDYECLLKEVKKILK